jgi:hypothetical protein
MIFFQEKILGDEFCPKFWDKASPVACYRLPYARAQILIHAPSKIFGLHNRQNNLSPAGWASNFSPKKLNKK